MKILHVASEVAPLSKVGGLGDVAGSLPKALHRLGADVRIITPAWPGVLDKAREEGKKITRLPPLIHVALQWHVISAKVWKTIIEDVPIYIIENNSLFEKIPIYPDELTVESSLPFAFFSLAALELEQKSRWDPDIIHCHDWPSALVPISFRWHKFYRTQKPYPLTVLTIHNIAHQGVLPFHVLEEWGIDTQSFSIDGLEFYGHVNLLKGGIVTADSVTTVSPQYAEEIQTQEMGFGLDGVIKENKNKLYGILNGIDDTWSPERDPLLSCHYSSEELNGKKNCRKNLLEQLGWEDDESPLLLSISRLAMQKGYDILIPALDTIRDMGIRCLFIGSGNPLFSTSLREKATLYPDRISFLNGFHEKFSHLAYAGADMLIMPSHFEPCGLSQLIALRYGTVPVARMTGGIIDTILDADHFSDGYGFTFSPYTTEALVKTVQRALDAFKNQNRWEEIMQRGMVKDFSWKSSSQKYFDLYQKMLREKRR